MAESDQRTSLGRPFFSSIFFGRAKKMDPWSADGTALYNAASRRQKNSLARGCENPLNTHRVSDTNQLIPSPSPASASWENSLSFVYKVGVTVVVNDAGKQEPGKSLLFSRLFLAGCTQHGFIIALLNTGG